MNWTIKNKLTGIGVLAVAGLLAIAVPTINAVQELMKADQEREHRDQQVLLLNHVLTNSAQMVRYAMDVIVIANSGGASEDALKNLHREIKELQDDLPVLEKMAETEQEKGYHREIIAIQSQLVLTLSDRLIDAAKGRKLKELQEIDRVVDEDGDRLMEVVEQYRISVENEAKIVNQVERSALDALRKVTLGASVVSITLLVVLLYAVIRGITHAIGLMTTGMRRLADKDMSVEIPGLGRADELGQMANAVQVFKENMIKADSLAAEKEVEDRRKEAERLRIEEVMKHLKQVIDGVAAGDLTWQAKVEGGQDDELVGLARNLNMMISNLAAVTRQIHEASDTMASSLAEVRSALTSQAAAAAEQASAINETTSTLSEIRATTKQTLEKALALGEQSEKARAESQRGRGAVGEAVNGMDKVRQRVEDVAASILELSKKTQQIGEITEVVDDLARQSKMLALNASIEAAKAGEAGQGFAVVAEEIRNLAEQSRESTAQVRTILQDIQSSSEHTVMVTEEGTKQVAIGSRLIDDAGKVIGNLGEVVQQTTMASQQITAAVRQEVAGVDQIVVAMGEISTATNNAVSSTRQTEVALADLGRVAEQLKDRVQVYRI